MSDELPLEERVVEVLDDAPGEAASAASIRGLLATERGTRPAFDDLQDALSDLMDEGRVEVVSVEEDDDPRYRLVETGY